MNTSCALIPGDARRQAKAPIDMPDIGGNDRNVKDGRLFRDGVGFTQVHRKAHEAEGLVSGGGQCCLAWS